MSTNGVRRSQCPSRTSEQRGVVARVSVKRHHGPRALAEEDEDKVTSKWVARVDAERRKRGWSYRKFAEELAAHSRVSVSHSAVAKLLSRRSDGEPVLGMSHLVAPICALFGIARGVVDNPDVTDDADRREVALLEAFRKMPRDQQDRFIAWLVGEVKSR